MKKIRLTKLKFLADNRFPPRGAGISVNGTSWEGEESPMTPEPIVGRPFFISNYKTSLVQKILTGNTFETLNSVYKWEIIE